MPILKLEGITLAFGGVTAISQVDLEVYAGEICAIIGPNGAGKSSLLNIVNGVYRANAGELVFNGVHFRRITPLRAARLGIGRTFQHNALFKPLTVLDNVLAGLTRHSRTTLLEHAFGLPREPRRKPGFRSPRGGDARLSRTGAAPGRRGLDAALRAAKNASTLPAPLSAARLSSCSTSRWRA